MYLTFSRIFAGKQIYYMILTGNVCLHFFTLHLKPSPNTSKYLISPNNDNLTGNFIYTIAIAPVYRLVHLTNYCGPTVTFFRDKFLSFPILCSVRLLFFSSTTRSYATIEKHSPYISKIIDIICPYNLCLLIVFFVYV